MTRDISIRQQFNGWRVRWTHIGDVNPTVESEETSTQERVFGTLESATDFVNSMLV